jgi:hypothetical protein
MHFQAWPWSLLTILGDMVELTVLIDGDSISGTQIKGEYISRFKRSGKTVGSRYSRLPCSLQLCGMKMYFAVRCSPDAGFDSRHPIFRRKACALCEIMEFNAASSHSFRKRLTVVLPGKQLVQVHTVGQFKHQFP